MELPVNHFKRRLQAGDDPQIGLWLGLADSSCAEICAGAGFEWLLLDAEHAPNDLRTLLGQLQAIAAYPDVQPLVRMPWGDAVEIKKVLDLGAQTLLIPMVESAKQAAELVQASHYPPAGKRGVGSALARASRWNGIPGYLDHADEQICLLAQLESKPGLDNLEAIAAVEGIEGLFIGPADLAAALGYRGNPGHPEVQAVIEETIGRIQDAGKPAGILSANEKLARRYLELGVQFIAVGVDTTLLGGATRALARRFKELEPEGALSGGSIY